MVSNYRREQGGFANPLLNNPRREFTTIFEGDLATDGSTRWSTAGPVGNLPAVDNGALHLYADDTAGGFVGQFGTDAGPIDEMNLNPLVSFRAALINNTADPAEAYLTFGFVGDGSSAPAPDQIHFGFHLESDGENVTIKGSCGNNEEGSHTETGDLAQFPGEAGSVCEYLAIKTDSEIVFYVNGTRRGSIQNSALIPDGNANGGFLCATVSSEVSISAIGATLHVELASYSHDLTY